jgi:hypothetical protein
MSEAFNPEEYMISNSLSVAGITYSRGEYLPATVSQEEVHHWVAAGALIKKGGTPVVPKPGDAQNYLRAVDVMVLESIATHRPNAATLREMEEMARQANRSPILVGALHVAALYAEPWKPWDKPVARTEPAVEEKPDEAVEEDVEDDEQEEESEKKEEEAATPRPRRAARRT